MSRFHPLHALQPDQARAADPAIHAALSASAGTGKTQVLTARVLKLLLGGTRPETILCLTFTKAGAAEMANRIGDRLASWVRLPDAALRKELFALNQPTGPDEMLRARRLFAEVLDAPGGLRIQTIHSFAQTLLAAFPAEAGITPGFRPIEGREEQLLARRTLAQLVSDAEGRGNDALIADVQALSRRLGERDAERYLMSCAREPEAMAYFASPDVVEPALRSRLGLPEGPIEEIVAARCADDSFDCALLSAIAAGHRGWGAKTGLSVAEDIDRWLALAPAERCRELGQLAQVVFTQSGERRKVPAGLLKVDPDSQAQCDDLAEAVAELVDLQRRAELVAVQAAGLRAGAAFAEAYTLAKRTAGVADFDDLIRWTRELLAKPGMGDWVRYKLDRRTDHLLVDEAQDTNADQWTIVFALIDEFFSGQGAGGSHRTIFTVGDFKQAIYGFQGTDPREFENARAAIRERVRLLEEAAKEDEDVVVRPFHDLSIDRSFRSAQPVLDVVDSVIATIGPAEMGLPDEPNPHRAHHSGRPGCVEIWKPFAPAADEEGGEEGEEGWLAEPARRFATELAAKVRGWLDEGPVLATTRQKLSAGDILILVRSRGELASLIVARLFAAGVPVAGIDRLHLSSPLAVKDLMAAVAFAVQPLDDLTLANLLVSPLIGWNQDQLYRLAYGRNRSLWAELGHRRAERADFSQARTLLEGLLGMADYTTPARFLETILSGPMQGRRKLLERLGPAARDPIDELVAAAFEFERSEIASLDRFLAWFGQGDVEIKRDPSAPSNAVRVMTVHGAKGLEAPIVILADATSDPAKLGEKNGPIAWPMGEAGNAPVIRPRKMEMCDPYALIVEQGKARDLQEHWRLLYVALTRAAEGLVVAGVAPSRGELPEQSWHARVQVAMERLGAVWEGDVLRYSGAGGSVVTSAAPKPKTALPAPTLPDWLHRQAPEESRPPRPLAPSQLVEDQDAAPPPSPALRAAARRGTLLHALFERLPGVPEAERREAAFHWLEHSAGVAEPSLREEVVAAACSIIGADNYAELFGAESLAEAPIAATLEDGRVVAGTVDRLVVAPDRVRVVDFKTGRQVPATAAEVPSSHRQQMEAYAAALTVIFPGRRIETALLYTSGPQLIVLTG